MSIFKCPGSDLIKSPRAEDITCPGCGEAVEIWSDEAEVTCLVCGTSIFREMPSACWEWCGSARECVGPDRYDRLVRGRKRKEREGLKEKLIAAMQMYFGDDEKRIRHAQSVLLYAEEILKTEPGDRRVVLASALLHDIGIPNAIRIHGSSSHRFQEQEGPPVAREIMEKLGIDQAVIDKVADIIAHHHSPRGEESSDFKIVYDADQIVNLAERDGSAAELFYARLLTAKGKAIMYRLYPFLGRFIPNRQCFPDQSNEPLIVKVSIGDRRKERASNKYPRLFHGYAQFIRFFAIYSDPSQDKDQEILKISGLFFLPADTRYRATGIPGRLLTLKTKHTHNTTSLN